jgi:hypothetical protein
MAMARFSLMMAAALMLGASSASAQRAPTTERVPFDVTPVPFGPGEEIHYRISASWTIIRGGGDGSLRVEGIDTIRGHPSYRLAFYMKGGITVFKMDDVQRSWFDVNELFSRRFQQKINQTTYQRDKVLDFFPEQLQWTARDLLRPTKPEEHGDLASEIPLDDVSFLYHVRTMALRVGESVTLPRYFKEDGNPVVIRVLRKERVKVPYGEFDAIVVQPIIETDDSSLFSQDGEARVWFTDDERRLLVKLEAKAGKGISLRMEMFAYAPGTRLLGPPDTAGGTQ